MPRINKLSLAFAAFVVVGLAPAAVQAIPSQCDAVPGNIVLNCGFETGSFVPGWTQSGNTAGGTTYVSPGMTLAHSGDFFAVFGPEGSLGFITQTLVTVPGASYNLSFYLRNLRAGTPNQFQVSFNGVVLQTLTDQPPTADYILFTFSNLVATGAATQLQFGFRHDPDFWLFDDVVVTPAGAPIPEPTTMLLLGTGLAGVGAAVRKRRRP